MLSAIVGHWRFRTGIPPAQCHADAWPPPAVSPACTAVLAAVLAILHAWHSQLSTLVEQPEAALVSLSKQPKTCSVACWLSESSLIVS